MMKKNKIIASVVVLFAAIAVNGCISCSYHVKEVLGETRPCLFPGFMYYFKGSDKGIWDGYLKEILRTLPYGVLLPAFTLSDLCADVLFLPLDLVGQAYPTSEYVELSSSGKSLVLSGRQGLFRYSTEEALVLEIDAEAGFFLVEAAGYPPSDLDLYLPCRCAVLLSGAQEDEDRELVSFGNQKEMRYSGHLKLMLYPPVFRFMGSSDEHWSFQIMTDKAEVSRRMSFVKSGFTKDFKGTIKVGRAADHCCAMEVIRLENGIVTESGGDAKGKMVERQQ